MDVIINNAGPSATPQVQQYAPITQTPNGYGPGYGEYQNNQDHHGGPGFLLPLLLVGGFFFFRGRNKRRRQMMRRWQMAGGQAMPEGNANPNHDAPDFVDDIRENFKRGRQRLFNDGALNIARERYARGEINEGEYQAIAKALMGEQSSTGRVNMDKDTPPGNIV
ncbi:hypothetical protein [Deinococcus sp.]|uniref:hypothetical protein n=1 Tax=Deinococcus sp. TaxID=47478 RepID=UPI003B5A0B79